MLDIHGLQQRALLLQAIRSFFLQHGYLEVDTPIRQPIALPESNIIPLASEGWLLQTSPELCMKRLLARGCDRIFQICHCFRKEEKGRLHNPEFTMLEWYRKNSDYQDLMHECEAMITSVWQALRPHAPGKSQHWPNLAWGNARVDLTPPWPRMTVAEAFARYAGQSVDALLAADRFDEVLVSEVEPYLGQEQPVFLYDYPVALGSLARRKQGVPEIAERFELYIAGVELANGFSELVDSQEQRRRFALEIEKLGAAGFLAAMPEEFLRDLDMIDDAAGIALGVDRLCMLCWGYEDLGSALSFTY